AALHLAHRQLGVRRDQPGRLGDVDGVQGGLQRGPADPGVINATGADLQFVVVAVARLGDERETQDGHRRVPVQLRGRPNRPGQPVFGVDGRPEIDTHRAHRHRGHGRDHTDHQLPHPHILTHRGRTAFFRAADRQVARYRGRAVGRVTAACQPWIWEITGDIDVLGDVPARWRASWIYYC